MSLIKPDFVSIEEAAKRLKISPETLKWNIANGHVSVYIKTPAEHKMYPPTLLPQTDLNRHERIADTSHWYKDSKNGQEYLVFQKLVALDTSWNEINTVSGSHFAREQADLYIYLPDFPEENREEQEPETPPQKLSTRLLQAKEQMRIWLINNDECTSNEYVDRILAIPKFSDLNKLTLIKKAKEMLAEEGRKDLIRSQAGRPKKK